MVTKKDLTEVVATAYWSEADARVAIAAWRASGQSMVAFARTQRIGPHRLQWWRRRIGERSIESAARPRTPRLVPIEVVTGAAPAAAPPAPIEIAIGRFAVRVAASCDAATLRRVIEVLGSC